MADSNLLYAESFRLLGLRLLNKPVGGSIHLQNRRFRAFFGTSWTLCSVLWYDIQPVIQEEKREV